MAAASASSSSEKSGVSRVVEWYENETAFSSSPEDNASVGSTDKGEGEDEHEDDPLHLAITADARALATK